MVFFSAKCSDNFDIYAVIQNVSAAHSSDDELKLIPPPELYQYKIVTVLH